MVVGVLSAGVNPGERGRGECTDAEPEKGQERDGMRGQAPAQRAWRGRREGLLFEVHGD